MHCDIQPSIHKTNTLEFIPSLELPSSHKSSGFILVSVLSFILLTTLSIAAILNMTVTQLRILSSEKSHLQQFYLTEKKLINAEKLLASGLDVSHLVEVDTFKPKNFRNKSGISSQHLKLTASTNHLHGQTKLQSIIRVDVPNEKSSSSTKSNKAPKQTERTIHRLEWKKP